MERTGEGMEVGSGSVSVEFDARNVVVIAACDVDWEEGRAV